MAACYTRRLCAQTSEEFQGSFLGEMNFKLNQDNRSEFLRYRNMAEDARGYCWHN